MLQKPGLGSLLEWAVFPGILILKLSKVEPTPFPLEGPGRAGGWGPPPEGVLGSCVPLLLGSPSTRAPQLGCPGPSRPVSRLMQELGMSTCCPPVGTLSSRRPQLSSLLIFGILGSLAMSALLGAGLGACAGTTLPGGESERPPEAFDDTDLRGIERLASPFNRESSLCFKPGLLTLDKFWAWPA